MLGWANDRGGETMICTNRVRGVKEPVAFLAASLCFLMQVSRAQVPPPTNAQPGGQGGGIYPTYEPDDSSGFVPIFDGKTLKDWDGDPTFWRVEDGEIVGETTSEKVVKVNNFLIWRGGTVKDFELKGEVKLSGTKSGIQDRSLELPNVGKWVLKGYQADMDWATCSHCKLVRSDRGSTCRNRFCYSLFRKNIDAGISFIAFGAHRCHHALVTSSFELVKAFPMRRKLGRLE